MSNVKLGKGCVICDDTEIHGDVTIGNGTIIHPKVRIIAEAGPIFIGEGNLIEEKTMIINKANFEAKGSTPVMIIGNFNVFEVGSHCEALKVGDSNLFEVKSHVGREVVISCECIIGAGCEMLDAEVLPEYTAVYGKYCQRFLTQGHQGPAHQMETLAKVIPQYHSVGKKYKGKSA